MEPKPFTFWPSISGRVISRDVSLILEESNPRILYTEDNDDSRYLVKLLLEMEGFDVTCAEDSAETLSLAKAEKFDLYLLANWLPGTSGCDLCRQIREFDKATPILFYSGVEGDAEKAISVALRAT